MKRIIFLRGWQSLCPLGQCLFSAQLCKVRHDDQIPIKQAGNFKSLSNRALWEENSGAIIKMICSQCPTCHFRNFLRENWLAQIEYPVMCTNYFERSPLHLLNMKLGQNQMTPSGLSHKYQLKPIYQAILQYILLSQYYFIKLAICHEWPDIKQRQLVQNMITSLTLEMPIRLPHPSLTCSISDKQYILIVWN